ncbi:hypothetical protein, partial [Clostridium perfringens]|uniref:hypothetical protein n=1 Tax=Clostridium perfringens TaxID=1502 RepID=UPI0037552855
MEATFNEWKASREADYAGLQTQADALATQITSAKADLDAKVAAAQTAVGTAKADALAAVDDAVAKLNTAIEDFNAADFYTKAEADALLLQKVDRSSY